MLRRGESQVIVNGLSEGDTVAMANPTLSQERTPKAGGAAKAIAK
jgi:hypothetical protein